MKKTVHSPAGEAAASRAAPEAGPMAALTGSAPFARSDLGMKLAATMRSGSPSQRRMAEFMLRNPVRVAAWGIEEAAAQSGVSAPTISRLARELGFAGFAEMRSAVAQTLQMAFEPIAKLRDRVEQGEAEGGSGAAELAQRQIAAASDETTLRLAKAVARRIAAARTVYVMGFGMSAHLAALLTLGLQPFCDQVINTVEFGGTEVAAGRLMSVSEQDLLIAITFPRYASDVVQLARYARDRKARIVAITDSAASPLAPYADDLLTVGSEHPVLSSSNVAAVYLVETLVAEVMTSSRANVEKAAKLTEAISAYLHTRR